MNLLKIVGAVLVVLLVLLVIAPQEKLDRLGLAWSRTTGNPGILCLDYQRQYLKDPVSAELLEHSAIKESEISIRYRAKNSYGAYQTSTAICAISNGVINTQATEITREVQKLKEENLALDESLKCLESKNEFLRKGDSSEVARSKLSSRCLEIMKQ